MKLTKRHIGGLFDVRGGDGSWLYRLVDVKKGRLLFYSFNGQYVIEKQGANDWQEYDHKSWDSVWTERGWKYPAFIDGKKVSYEKA